MEALTLTSKWQDLLPNSVIQEATLEKLERIDSDQREVTCWAEDALATVAIAFESRNLKLSHLDLAVREWLGTGPAQFFLPNGES